MSRGAVASESQAVVAAWERLRARLHLFTAAREALRQPATADELARAEAQLGFELPAALRALLSSSNGQRPDSAGVFKLVAGWDVYRRLVFLDVESIVVAYRDLLHDAVCRSCFGEDELPFALHGSASCGWACSVHRQTGAVSLLATEAADWTLPDEWQVSRHPCTPGLAAFLDEQIAAYR